MRRLGSLTLLAVLVVGVASECWAVTVPYVPNGPLRIYTRDRDMGTGYSGPDGTYTRANPDSNFVGLDRFGPPGALAKEDTWGLFNFYLLKPGAINPIGNDIVDGPGLPYYEWTDGGAMTGDTALVGMVFGGWDKEVILDSTGLNPLTILVADLQFELWAVDKANVNLDFGKSGPAYVDGNRTAANEYEGWVDKDDATKVLLLTGTSTYFKFSGSQNVNTGTFDGDTLAYFDVDENGPGAWDTYWGTGAFFTDDNGNPADVKLTFNIDTGSNGWSVNSNDDGGVLTIPEPLTVLGVVLSGLGVGGYLRRRRAV